MKDIYIVYEDSHGQVSYWKKEKDAKKECLKIISERYTLKEISDQIQTVEQLLGYYVDILIAFSDEVYYIKVPFNTSWR